MLDGPLPPRKEPVLAVVLGLLWPGLGQVYAGRPGKGLLYCALVVGTFAAGLWMTRGAAVDPSNEPLWFVAQALAGAPTFGLERLTHDVRLADRVATFELGMLYTAVAGLMNVVAIADALGLVERRLLSRRRALEEQRLARAQAPAPVALQDVGGWPELAGAPVPAAAGIDPGALGVRADPSPAPGEEPAP